MRKKVKKVAIIVAIWVILAIPYFIDTDQAVAAETAFPYETEVLAVLKGEWPKEILAIDLEIAYAALSYDLNRNLFSALIFKESYFDPSWERGWELCPDGPVTASCTSVSGAIGPAQVMPFHFDENEDPRDLMTNLLKGANILSDYIAQMGSVRDGLAAYNCGPNGELGKWCYEFADAVLQIFKENVGHPYPFAE